MATGAYLTRHRDIDTALAITFCSTALGLCAPVIAPLWATCMIVRMVTKPIER